MATKLTYSGETCLADPLTSCLPVPPAPDFAGPWPADGATALEALGRLKHETAASLAELGWTGVHGGAVEIGGRRALFLGGSGAGKSTMAAVLARRGHAVADELVFIRPRPEPVDGREGGIVLLSTGLPLALREESLELFPCAARWRCGPARLSSGKVLLAPPGQLAPGSTRLSSSQAAGARPTAGLLRGTGTVGAIVVLEGRPPPPELRDSATSLRTIDGVTAARALLAGVLRRPESEGPLSSCGDRATVQRPELQRPSAAEAPEGALRSFSGIGRRRALRRRAWACVCAALDSVPAYGLRADLLRDGDLVARDIDRMLERGAA